MCFSVAPKRSAMACQHIGGQDHIRAARRKALRGGIAFDVEQRRHQPGAREFPLRRGQEGRRDIGEAIVARRFGQRIQQRAGGAAGTGADLHDAKAAALRRRGGQSRGGGAQQAVDGVGIGGGFVEGAGPGLIGGEEQPEGFGRPVRTSARASPQRRSTATSPCMAGAAARTASMAGGSSGGLRSTVQRRRSRFSTPSSASIDSSRWNRR